MSDKDKVFMLKMRIRLLSLRSMISVVLVPKGLLQFCFVQTIKPQILLVANRLK